MREVWRAVVGTTWSLVEVGANDRGPLGSSAIDDSGCGSAMASRSFSGPNLYGPGMFLLPHSLVALFRLLPIRDTDTPPTPLYIPTASRALPSIHGLTRFNTHQIHIYSLSAGLGAIKAMVYMYMQVHA